ncbi:phage tail protein [Vannielia litorea]|uniref:phage tail protein n=1 Tax=Vannielia litorea TaxID=1217970 RepID=UPI001BCB3B4C|nr:tail fiber protein [Vannielia litorea]MBS8225781.1 phage tail protein [Vannielia litorea]
MSYTPKPVTSALAILATTVALITPSAPARAGADPSLGDVMIVGFNFCPRGWAKAEGQLLPINQNQSLYSLLGTQFGGDGRTSFALPDLRGRFTMGQGSGAGLTPRTAGQKGGAETRTMTVAQMPAHSHSVNANNLDGDRPGPGGKLLAAAPTGGTGNETIYSQDAPNVTMNPTMIAHSGGSQAFPVVDPFLALTHCIAIQGIFPSRN